jgi:hypothetical protein
MGFFDDMTDALKTYPETDVKLEIVEVDFPDQALNTAETATFRVQVSNNGPLELTNVTLRIKGLNGATVANNGAAAPFVSEFVTQELPTIAGHNGVEKTVGSPLKFKAPGSAQPARNLVSATLEGWNANLNHILIGHSDPLESVKATFATEVVPK